MFMFAWALAQCAHRKQYNRNLWYSVKFVNIQVWDSIIEQKGFSCVCDVLNRQTEYNSHVSKQYIYIVQSMASIRASMFHYTHSKRHTHETCTLYILFVEWLHFFSLTLVDSIIPWIHRLESIVVAYFIWFHLYSSVKIEKQRHCIKKETFWSKFKKKSIFCSANRKNSYKQSKYVTKTFVHTTALLFSIFFCERKKSPYGENWWCRYRMKPYFVWHGNYG